MRKEMPLYRDAAAAPGLPDWLTAHFIVHAENMLRDDTAPVSEPTHVLRPRTARKPEVAPEPILVPQNLTPGQPGLVHDPRSQSQRPASEYPNRTLDIDEWIIACEAYLGLDADSEYKHVFAPTTPKNSFWYARKLSWIIGEASANGRDAARQFKRDNLRGPAFNALIGFLDIADECNARAKAYAGEAITEAMLEAENPQETRAWQNMQDVVEGQRRTTRLPGISMALDEWAVDELVAIANDSAGNIIYKVRWLGMGPEQDSWVSAGDISQDLIDEYQAGGR